MRIRYRFKLSQPIRLEDHWPLEIMGGQLQIVSNNGIASAIEILFQGQSTDLSPDIHIDEGGSPKTSIIMRDNLLPVVQRYLERSFMYIQCYFGAEILTEELDVTYEGENSKEEDKIKIKKYNTRKQNTPTFIPYDLMTRAFMASEEGTAPEIESTLCKIARTAMLEKRYADSFRYSFLLIDFIFGDGQFKSQQLKEKLKQNSIFTDIVSKSIKNRMESMRDKSSDTFRLLSSSPSVAQVIDHIVDKRGFYFHGSTKRKDSWMPHEQDTAETLCLLTLEIAQQISHEAATPMFSGALEKRHFDQAKQAGAILEMKIIFNYRGPEDTEYKNGSINISAPGTKITPKLSLYAAKNFLEHFEERYPTLSLKSARCAVISTNEKVFDIKIYGHENDASSDQ